jgi:hypothetical protein
VSFVVGSFQLAVADPTEEDCRREAAYIKREGIRLPSARARDSVGPLHCHSSISILADRISLISGDIPIKNGVVSRKRLPVLRKELAGHNPRLDKLGRLFGRMKKKWVRPYIGVAAMKGTPYSVIETVFASASASGLRPGLCLLTASLRCIPIKNVPAGAKHFLHIEINAKGPLTIKSSDRTARVPSRKRLARALRSIGKKKGLVAVSAEPKVTLQTLVSTLATIRAVGFKDVHLTVFSKAVGR